MKHVITHLRLLFWMWAFFTVGLAYVAASTASDWLDYFLDAIGARLDRAEEKVLFRLDS